MTKASVFQRTAFDRRMMEERRAAEYKAEQAEVEEFMEAEHRAQEAILETQGEGG